MENFDRKNITLKRISGRRIFLFASTAAALAADIAVLVLLLVAGITEVSYIIAPVIVLVADIAFLLFAIFSNFRFKYSLVGTVIFAAAETVALAIMLFAHLGSPRAVSALAAVFWLALHALTAIATVTLALGAANINKALRRAAVVPAAIVVACSVGYGVYAATFGVFGQGYVGGRRTLTFILDDSGEGYIANGYVAGRGDTVVIPDTFDGKPVTGIDCAVFSEIGIRNVSIQCSAVPKLRNLDALQSFSLATVGAGRANVDAMRSAYFKQAYEHIDGKNESQYVGYVEGLVKLAQSLYPCDLGSDEKYVTFDYSADDYDALKLVEGEVLPVWIGKNNQSFSVTDFDVEYAKHAKIDSDADLHWSYNNLDGRILTITNNGEHLTGTPSGVSVHGATVKFEKIYKITVGSDNDAVYETDKEFTACEYGDFIYAVESNADKRVIDVIPSRAGFDLEWEYDHAEDRVPFTALKDVVSELDGDSVTIHPVWSLFAPVITELKTNAANDTVTYGDGLKVTATVTAPASGFTLNYKWLVPNDVDIVADGSTMEVESMPIHGAGGYYVTVTARAPKITSLTSEAERSVSVMVAKRPLAFTWSELETSFYDATEKDISCTFDESAVVGDDEITFNQSAYKVRDSGTHSVSATLSGDAASKYRIGSGGSHIYNIKPCEIAVTWNYVSPYTYDGTYFQPKASATPLITVNTPDYDKLNITVKGNGRDAGNYTAIVDLGNDNYVAKGDSGKCEFVIDKRLITVEWEDNELTYNGKSQRPMILSVGGTVGGDAAGVLSSIVYGGAQVQASLDGEKYTATATLPQNSNYKFANDEPATCEYAIAKKAITVAVVSKSVKYTGRAFTAFDCTATGMVSGESIKDPTVATLSYSLQAPIPPTQVSRGFGARAGEDGKNVGEYDILLEVSARNYEAETIDGTLTVNPAILNFIISEVNETYAGTLYDGTSFKHSVIGLVNGETEADVLGAVTYSYKRVSETEWVSSVANCGVYDVTASFSNEGDTRYENYSVHVSSGRLFVTKAPLVVSADNKTKVYGESDPEFTSKVTGLVNGETLAEVTTLSYSCNGTNAGEHRITVSAADATNYTIECNYGTLTITPKPITVAVAAAADSKVYDGRKFDFTSSADGLLPDDTLVIIYRISKSGAAVSGDIINAGEYTVTPIVSHGNYDITVQSKTLTVTKAPLTITAEDKTMMYTGARATSLSCKASGIVDGKLINELVAVEITCGGIDVGTHDIAITGNQAENYDVTYVGGKLTVTKKPLTVSVVSVSGDDIKVYDGRPFAYAFAADGKADRDTLDVTYSITKDGAPFTGDIVAAGTYTVTPSVTHKNYDITVQSKTLTITKAALTVTADNKSKVYGAANPEFTSKVAGLVGGDELASVTSLSYLCDGVNVGSHDIAVSATAAANYDITCVKGTLTITPAALTVTASDKSKTFDGAPFTAAEVYSVTGVDGGFTVTTSPALDACVNADVYTVTITASGANYTTATKTVTITISAKSVAVVWTGVRDYAEGESVSVSASTEESGLVVELEYYANGVKLDGVPTAAGEYTVKAVCDSGNYALTNSEQSFKISVADENGGEEENDNEVR